MRRASGKTIYPCALACILSFIPLYGIHPSAGGQPQRSAMPLPQDARTFSYPAVALPSTSDIPDRARPVGIGDFAGGGSTIRVRVALGELAQPADLYVGLYAPTLDEKNILVLGPDNSLRPLQAGLVPWKSGTIGRVEEELFGEFPSSNLIPGRHDLFLQITPAGSLDRYYRWQTSFGLSALDAFAASIANPGELLSWMRSNISYGWPGWESDGNTMRTWRYLSPEEVYSLRQGDCTAQAAFEAYVLRQHGYDCRLLWLERARYSDHGVCYGRGPDGFYYMEHAFGGFEGFYGPFGSVEEIGAHIYQHMMESDGLSDSYTLWSYVEVPYGVNWTEFHRLLEPL